LNKNVKIGIIQINSSIGIIEENINKGIEKISIASKAGADIVCFPELFLTGYDMDRKELYSSEAVKKYQEYIINKLSYHAKKEELFIIAPTVIEKMGEVFNSALFFDKSGVLIGEYDKVHLFEKERDNFEKGRSFNVWDTEIGKIGIMICYDAGFPEAARVLTIKGAEIIFCPSAWRIQDKKLWNLNLEQRALENTNFLVGVNSVTRNEKLHLFGKSKIVGPNGETVAEANEDKEEVLIYSINLEDLKEYRKKYPYLKHRRPDMYGNLIE